MPGPRVPPEDHDYDHEAEDRRAWGELGRFLLLVAMVIVVFLLGRAMARHHFFGAGGQNVHQGHPAGP